MTFLPRLTLLATLLAGGSLHAKPIYSVSYGTQLVLRTLQLGPLPVTGVIFDSLVPPQTDARWDLSQRSQVVNTVGMQVLSNCDAEPACHAALGEPAETLYRRVLDKAQADPTVLAKIPGKNLKNFLGGMLDVPVARARAARARTRLRAHQRHRAMDHAHGRRLGTPLHTGAMGPARRGHDVC